MAKAHLVTIWNPLDYLSPEELVRLDKRFDCTLQDATCLVFWTGLSHELARCWAEQHGLQTLTIAMGPLFSGRDIDSARYGKSSKAWSKYMKGASARFAEYACRNSQRAIVLTNPPPNVYSTREWSNYRNLEEPILKGALGGSGAIQIDYVHPTIKGATAFQYQVWPLDRSNEWYMFFRTLLPEEMREGRMQVELQQQKAQEGEAEKRKQAELEQKKVRERKEEKQKQAELERKKAQKEKEARRKQAELEQQEARKRKEARRKQAELEQQEARKRKEAKRKRVELEQQKAREKRAAKRKKI